jgi:hypothetical protein
MHPPPGTLPAVTRGAPPTEVQPGGMSVAASRVVTNLAVSKVCAVAVGVGVAWTAAGDTDEVGAPLVADPAPEQLTIAAVTRALVPMPVPCRRKRWACTLVTRYERPSVDTWRSSYTVARRWQRNLRGPMAANGNPTPVGPESDPTGDERSATLARCTRTPRNRPWCDRNPGVP